MQTILNPYVHFHTVGFIPFDIVLPLLVLALASSLLDGVAGFCKVSSLALAPNFESAVELLLNPVTGLGTAVV